jgi:membrane protein YdbS with pleckstrin-like domain
MHISKLLVATKKFFCLIIQVLFHVALFCFMQLAMLVMFALLYTSTIFELIFGLCIIPCRLQWVRRQTRKADKVSKDQVPNKEIHR